MWFKSKKYGLGWTPASREGWIVTGLFFLGLYLVFRYTVLEDPERHNEFLMYVGILLSVFILIAYRTGEKLQWRWG